jgi:hypothetical protein
VAFSWQIVLVHAEHAHPFLGPIDGVTQGQFAIPTAGHPPENTHFEIVLTVTDTDGLAVSATRAIFPVISPLELDTAPSGIPIQLDGAPLPTPASYASLSGYQHTVEAPATYALDGTAHAFQCWSDGGDRVHAYQAPEGGASLIASYAPSPLQQLEATVPAANRNADSFPALGGEELANFYDALGLCVGREADGSTWQAGMQFALDLPQGATVTGAVLHLVATADTSGDPLATIRAYDVADAAPFDTAHAHALTAHHAATSAGVSWTLPAFTAGATYDSPDLSALIQAVVSRPDWNPGGFLGLVLDGSASAVGNHWRCVRNAASPDPPRLTVSWSVAPPPSGGPPGPVSGLRLGPAHSALAWDPAAEATSHDLLRGTLGAPFALDHACLAGDLATPQASDPAVPPPQAGFYYLARGRNACGPGSAGAASSGAPHSNPPCP